MSDIIDEIDALVDEQLAVGEPRTGYDFGNPTYPKCPHCHRHWHGLAITERIAAMYAYREYDESYIAAEDDSPVLCHGSNFIGPMPAQWGTQNRTTTVVIEDDLSWAGLRGIPLAMANAIRDLLMTQIPAAPVVDLSEWFPAGSFREGEGPTVVSSDEAYVTTHYMPDGWRQITAGPIHSGNDATGDAAE